MILAQFCVFGWHFDGLNNMENMERLTFSCHETATLFRQCFAQSEKEKKTNKT